MLSAIVNRRSIRNYENKPVSREMLEEIIQAAILAPSAKNRQPWKFVVLAGDAKEEMLAVMEKGMEREKKQPLLPGSAEHQSGAAYTKEIMRQASAVILVINPLGLDVEKPLTAEERIYEICNAQSIGAAMENMTLTATGLGLGSLWICDTYFAYAELKEWLHTKGELAAAMAIGYTNQIPKKRPRKELSEVTEWRI